MAERRTERRCPLAAEALLEIPLVDQTTRGKGLRGAAIDLTLQGCRLTTYQIPYEEYERFDFVGQHGFVTIELPYIEKPLRTEVAIVWTHFQRAKPPERPYCLFGLQFVEETDSLIASVQYVLNRVSNESFDSTLLEKPTADRLNRPSSGIVGIPLGQPKRPPRKH